MAFILLRNEWPTNLIIPKWIFKLNFFTRLKSHSVRKQEIEEPFLKRRIYESSRVWTFFPIHDTFFPPVFPFSHCLSNLWVTCARRMARNISPESRRFWEGGSAIMSILVLGQQLSSGLSFKKGMKILRIVVIIPASGILRNDASLDRDFFAYATAPPPFFFYVPYFFSVLKNLFYFLQKIEVYVAVWGIKTLSKKEKLENVAFPPLLSLDLGQFYRKLIQEKKNLLQNLKNMFEFFLLLKKIIKV